MALDACIRKTSRGMFLPARVLFLPARVLSFVLLSRVFFFFLLAFFLSSFYLAFLPARVLSFVLLSRVSSCPRFLFLRARVFFSFVLLSRVSSCSRSFFRPFVSRSFSSCSRSLFLPARIHFSQQIPLQNLHISKICCTFALKFKYTSTRLVEY